MKKRAKKRNFCVSLLRGCNFFFRLRPSRVPLNIKGKCRGRGINTGRGDLDFGFQRFVLQDSLVLSLLIKKALKSHRPEAERAPSEEERFGRAPQIFELRLFLTLLDIPLKRLIPSPWRIGGRNVPPSQNVRNLNGTTQLTYFASIASFHIFFTTIHKNQPTHFKKTCGIDVAS